MVRALVSDSVKSGKSVDNKKRVLSLAETRSHFVLSTDFTDFTDFLLRSGGVRAVVSVSVKSGKSVDNKKRGALRESMIRFFYLLILLILLIFATLGWGTCGCLGFS